MTFSQLYFSLEGRISRSTFWLKLILPLTIILYAFLFIDIALEAEGVIYIIAALVLLWPNIAAGVKRLHDRNKSAWWLLITLIPIAGVIWYLIDVGILKGTEGDNQFGPDPLASS